MSLSPKFALKKKQSPKIVFPSVAMIDVIIQLRIVFPTVISYLNEYYVVTANLCVIP